MLQGFHGRAALLALTWALAAGEADAEPKPKPDAAVDAVAVLGGDADVRSATLVGRSGQLYVAGTEPGAWKRDGLGGVAIDVTAAVRAGGRLFVLGTRAPAFERIGDAWHVHPLPNRGRAAAAGAPVPVLAIGRHLYLQRGDGWRRVSSGREAITAVWAAAPDRIYAAARTGTLHMVSGGRWRDIPTPLAAGDPVVELAGVPGKALYARSRANVLLAVGPARATAVDAPDFVAHTLGTAGGQVWVAGAIGERLVARPLAAGALGPPEELPVGDGDRATLIHGDATGRLLVATAHGVLLLREGSSWRRAHIEVPPPRPPHPGSAPARTR